MTGRHSCFHRLRHAWRHGSLPLTLGLASALTASIARAQDTAAVVAPPSDAKWAGSIVALNTIRGSASLTIEPRNATDARIRLQLRAVPINLRVSWDVVAGSCGDEGRPVAAAAAFRQILTRNDGSGDVQVTLPKLARGKRYYFRVFAPGEVPADRGGYGCANLSEDRE